MREEEIIKLWLQGYSKYKVAEIYKNSYNQKIKIIRSEMRNRHSGRFISTREALAEVEKTILKETRRR